MNQGLNNMLTGIDNRTLDVIRVLGFIGGLAFILFTGWTVYITNSFDGTAYGIGFGGLLVSIGGALQIKKSTEPPGDT